MSTSAVAYVFWAAYTLFVAVCVRWLVVYIADLRRDRADKLRVQINDEQWRKLKEELHEQARFTDRR